MARAECDGEASPAPLPGIRFGVPAACGPIRMRAANACGVRAGTRGHANRHREIATEG
jgi:hypothetical protein